jgi:hypothetical protein
MLKFYFHRHITIATIFTDISTASMILVAFTTATNLHSHFWIFIKKFAVFGKALGYIDSSLS